MTVAQYALHGPVMERLEILGRPLNESLQALKYDAQKATKNEIEHHVHGERRLSCLPRVDHPICNRAQFWFFFLHQ